MIFSMFIKTKISLSVKFFFANLHKISTFVKQKNLF